MARGASLPSLVSSAESGNSQYGNILTHTSWNQRFIFSKGVPKVFTSPIFFKKLGETYKRPLYFEHSERVSDSFSVSACSEIFSLICFNDPIGKSFRGTEKRTNVKERCNKSCPTSSQSFPQLNIWGAQIGLRYCPVIKLKNFNHDIPYLSRKGYSCYTMSKCYTIPRVIPCQNGRFIPVESNIKGRRLDVQKRPQGYVLFSSTKPKIPKTCKFQMEESILSVPWPLLWFRTSHKDINKVDENSHFSVEKTVCTTDYFSGQYFSVNSFCPFHKRKKGRLSAVPGSTGEVIWLHNGTKPINCSPSINRNCSSASASTISSHAETTNFRIAGKRGLQLKYNFVCGGEDKTGLVSAKSSFNQGKTNTFCISSVNNSFRCFFKSMGRFLTKTLDWEIIDIVRKQISCKCFKLGGRKAWNSDF